MVNYKPNALTYKVLPWYKRYTTEIVVRVMLKYIKQWQFRAQAFVWPLLFCLK